MDKLISNNKSKIIAVLLILAAINRLLPVITGVIPFSFDHGKDSLAILDMMLNFDLKFIGPWTSIPGLHFGPGWYYLLLPTYIISQGHPVAPVILMLLLSLLIIWLSYKHLNFWMAVIVSMGKIWSTIAISAWNPFPMALLSCLFLIKIKQLKQQNSISSADCFFLSFLAALGFHFSTAYAIFIPLLLPLSIYLLPIKINLKQDWNKLLVAAFGFLLPFVPQLLFEVKHDFIQVKAVGSYLTSGRPTQFSFSKLSQVWLTFFKELHSYLWFDLPHSIQIKNDSSINLSVVFFAVIILFTFLAVLRSSFISLRRGHSEIKFKPQQIFKLFVVEHKLIAISLLWIIIPLIGFSFLHFNFWYLLAMAPWVVFIWSRLVQKAPAGVRVFILASAILTLTVNSYQFYTTDRQALAQKRDFLPAKLQALRYVRKAVGQRSFASYHYVPAVYDFSYQYLYFWQALQGLDLPQEFAYKPGENAYVKQKQALLSYFYSKQPSAFNKQQKPGEKSSAVEIIAFIVEEPIRQDDLDHWWQQQSYQKIITTQEITSDITVYLATPKY